MRGIARGGVSWGCYARMRRSSQRLEASEVAAGTLRTCCTCVADGGSACAALATGRFAVSLGVGVRILVGVDGVVVVSTRRDIEGRTASTTTAPTAVAASPAGTAALTILTTARIVASVCEHLATFTSATSAAARTSSAASTATSTEAAGDLIVRDGGHV